MKINHIIGIKPNRDIQTMSPGSKRKKECVKERHNLRQDNYDNINTSIKSNPDARVSFKGGAVPLVHKGAQFISQYPLVGEALVALGITCSLRPAAIMATAKNEEDKEKCNYQAAKSVSTGVVGLVMSAVVGSAIGNATKKANENKSFEMPKEMKEKSMQVIDEGIKALEELGQSLTQSGTNSALAEQIKKITENNQLNLNVLNSKEKNGIKNFKKQIKATAPNISEIVGKAIDEQLTVNNYAKAAKNVADKFFQPVFMPIRATVTIALIPPLLAALGLKKSCNKNDAHCNGFATINNDIFKADIFKNDVFTRDDDYAFSRSFYGVKKHENK